ncbi:MAG: hypothetical protein QOJ09_1631 [Actinomycetota bacterium]|jgi:hypothetical protein|nr:hypothetical protein [Actinomycetota bacterium]
MTNRTRVAAVVVAIVGLAGACGGGGGTETHAPPAAKIDPKAGGYIGGPVNGAKTQASNLDQSQQQLEQQTGG